MPVPNVVVTIEAGGTAGGAQDEDTGAWLPDDPEPTKLWEGKAFYLDEGVALETDAATGVPTLRADGQLILPKKTVAKAGIEQGHTVHMEYRSDGKEVDATVLRAVRATDIVYLTRA